MLFHKRRKIVIYVQGIYILYALNLIMYLNIWMKKKNGTFLAITKCSR